MLNNHILKFKTIYKLFEIQVKKNPQKIAVEYGKEKITYKELDKKTEKLAKELRDVELKTNKIVCAVVDCNIDLVVAVLSIIRAELIVFLIDKNYSENKINKILVASGGEVALISERIAGAIDKIWKIKNIDKKKSKQQQKSFKIICNQKKKIAFIVSTSGSTGNNKYVALSHEGVINNLYQRVKISNISSKDVSCLSSLLEFVSAPHHILLPLIVGARLVIYSQKTIKEPYLLLKNIDRDNVTVIEFGVHYLSAYISIVKIDKRKKLQFKKLRIVWLSHSKTSIHIVNYFFEKHNNIQLVIAYGCTEYSKILNNKLSKKICIDKISEGRPTINTKIYILNGNMKKLPLGIVGELFVSGLGISCGYVYDKKRTDKVFLPHPFCKGENIYRTGDLARINKDGNVEILGRVNDQIKIRGHRIDTEEITANFITHKNIKDVVVVIRKLGKEKRLVVYYVTNNNKKISTKSFKSHLNGVLPKYMVPSIFVPLKKMPINQNGKIEKLKLPSLTENDLLRLKYQPPKTKIEKKVIEICQEVLNVKKVGLNDDFFDLGGHSLKVVQVLAKVNMEYGISMEINDLFEFSGLRDFIEKIEEIIVYRNILKLSMVTK